MEPAATTAPPPDSTAGRPWPRVSRWRIALPVVLIVAALVAAGVSATVHEHNGNGTTTASQPSAGSPTSRTSVPVTYAEAARAGHTRNYDWGPHCDQHTGRYKMPTDYAVPCVPVFHGTNGGEHRGRRDRQHHQPRLLPGPAGRADLRHSGGGWDAGEHLEDGAGLRRHVQQGLRALRASRKPHPVRSHWIRQRPGGRPCRRRHRRRATPRLRLHQRSRHDPRLRGRVGAAPRVLLGVRRLRHLRPDSTERTVPVGQPPHGRHVVADHGRLRRVQAQRQAGHLGGRSGHAPREALLHRGERDVGAARSGNGEVDRQR